MTTLFAPGTWSSVRAAMVCVAIAVPTSSCIDDHVMDIDDDEQVEPESVSRVGLQLVAEGLTSPVLLTPSADATGRRFIVDRIGLVRIVTGEDELVDQPFLDIRDAIVELSEDYDERGLLGLAFHPMYEVNGKLYIYYSAPLRIGAPAGYDHTARLSELTASIDSGNRVDPETERILLEVDQPQANHNGGTVAFGPDGYLYLSLGDGGGAGDLGDGHPPLGNGQDATTLLGSIARIDVDHGAPYAVPRDNPYVGREGADEIFAHGFRNPYRMSFDMAGSRGLFAADAGQVRWEEVDLVTLGGNYGWNIREGTHCFDREDATREPASCPHRGFDGEPLIDPILEYANADAEGGVGVAVVGGYVYRGAAIPGLLGEYVFGDYSASFDDPLGKIFAASRSDDDGTWTMRELSIEGRDPRRLDAYVLGFGQDELGEVYVLVSEEPGPTGRTGRVYRLVAAAPR